MLTFATLFSGIGSPDLAAERAGLKPLWMCEIAPFQRKVLAKRFLGLPIYDDIRTLTGAERPDILWASPPCQDLSVAGRRAGLAGARSGLFWDFVRLARELQPSWICMEQVPGLFSSNGGRDFDEAILALDELGYGLSWRVLDSRYLGVPQRRRRIYVVGSLGEPCPPEVLFEPEGGSGDLAARGEQGQGVADEAGVGFARSLRARANASHREDSDTYVPEVAYAITARDRKGVSQREGVTTLVETAQTLTSGANGRAGRRQEDDSNLVAHTLRSSGFDASEDGTGRGAPLISVTNDSMPVTMEDEVGALKIGSGLGIPSAPWVMRMREGKPGGGKGPLMREGESLTLATANDQTLFAPASVRRLTPTECERLQGFPDGWTCLCGIDPYDTNACKCPDGPRYAALGNAVTVNAAEWILRRLVRVAAEAEQAA